MNGGFTNRYVCKSLVPYDFNSAKQKLESHYSSVQGESYELRSIVSLEPEIIISEDERYLSGKLYFQNESKMIDYEITQDKKLINANNIRRNTFTVDFNLSSNGETILFRNSGKSVIEGSKILSSILSQNPDNIRNLNFNIKKIEADVLSKKLLGMWTFSFRDRHGNIKSGTSYGEDVDQDPMYDQVGSVPKNWIGIKKDIDDRIIKMAIFRKGTIRLLTNFEGEGNLPRIFEIIEELKEYQFIDEENTVVQSTQDQSDNTEFDESYSTA